MEIESPMLPNFLRNKVKGREKAVLIPIQDLTDEELAELGKEFTAALIKSAQKKRKAEAKERQITTANTMTHNWEEELKTLCRDAERAYWIPYFINLFKAALAERNRDTEIIHSLLDGMGMDERQHGGEAKGFNKAVEIIKDQLSKLTPVEEDKKE